MTNNIFKNFLELDFDKKAYIVHLTYQYPKYAKICPSCEGNGNFKHGRTVYFCVECGGTGKKRDPEPVYVVSEINPKEERIHIVSGIVRFPMFTNVQGIFNKKSDAKKLADNLNLKNGTDK